MKIGYEPAEFEPFTITVETSEERDALAHAIEEGMNSTSFHEDTLLEDLVEFMADQQRREMRRR